jgi:predicted P-loop ATPase/GTPase
VAEWKGDTRFERALVNGSDLRVGLMRTGEWAWLAYDAPTLKRTGHGIEATKDAAKLAAEAHARAHAEEREC